MSQPKKHKVKPTRKQERTFLHMQKASSLREAMLKGGYSESSTIDPGKNFLEREGVKPLIEKYRDELINAGISTQLLAEIQAEGLFDQNSAIRLGYLKETKKDFGLAQDLNNNIQVNNIIAVKRNEYTV